MKFEETVWFKERPIEWETEQYAVFKCGFPVTNGHYLFVPKTTEYPGADRAVSACFKAAMIVGHNEKRKGTCDGYNIGMNNGEAAGQTCFYPHVHLILRREGDCTDPVGGVRGVIPGQGNYKLDTYVFPK